MSTLKEFRLKWPQYSDLSDQDLADGLYRKHYSDIPRDEFDRKIGLVSANSMSLERPVHQFTQATPRQNLAADAPKTPLQRTEQKMQEVTASTRYSPFAAQAGLDPTKTESTFDPDISGTVKAAKRLPGNIKKSIGAALVSNIAGGAEGVKEKQAGALESAAGVFSQPHPFAGQMRTLFGGAAAKAREEAGEFSGIAREARIGAEEAIPKDAGPIERAFQQGITSAGISLPAIVAAGPIAGTALLGAGVAGSRYSELRAAGIDEKEATNSALLLGSLEGLTEYIPGSTLVKRFPGFWQHLAEFMIREVPGENINTVAQMVDDYRHNLRDDITVDDLVSAVKETTAATLVGSGAQVGGVRLLQSLPEKVNAIAEGRGKPKQRPQSQPPEELEAPISQEPAPEQREPEKSAPTKPPAATEEEQSEPKPAIPEDEERAVLEAVQAGTATPEQEAQAEAMGYVEFTERNEAVMLPAGKKRLAEVVSQEQPDGPPAQDTENKRGGVSPGDSLAQKPAGQGAVTAETPEETGAPDPEQSGQGGAVQGAETEPQRNDRLYGTLETELTEDIEALESASLSTAERMRVRRTITALKPLLDEVRAERSGGDLQKLRDLHRRIAQVTGGDSASMELRKLTESEGTRWVSIADQEVEVNTKPTEPQKTAGNYKKGHVKLHGLDFSIENPKGSVREGKSANGRAWSRRMRAHYGYVRRTEGADGDHVDVFLGEKPSSDMVYVVDQLKPGAKDFDEHKVMVGFASQEEAEKNYASHYPKNWKGMGAVTPMRMDQFKDWLKSGDTKSPVAWKPAPKRSTKKPQAKYDSLLEYVSKVRLGKTSGLNFDELVSEGLDPADLKAARGHGLNRPFTKNGATLDQMAEHLAEAGFDVFDDEGRYDKNKTLDLVTRALRGEKIMSVASDDEFFRAAVERYEDQIKAEMDRRDETLDEQIDRLNAMQEEILQEWEETHGAIEESEREPGEDDGIMFHRSRRDPSLIVQHNLSERNLLFSVKRGGIPVPSLAVTKKDQSLTGFGEITLIGPSEMADPRGYAKTKVYGADIYSPRYPNIHFIFNSKAADELSKMLEPHAKRINESHSLYPDNLTEGPDSLRQNPAVMEMFLSGRGITAKIKDSTYTIGSLRDAIRDKNLRGEYDQFVEDLFYSFSPAERIFNGYDNYGRRKYKPHTLDNVIRTLKKDLRGGENFSYGVGSLRSKLTPQFTSIRNIVENEDRLMSSKEFQAVKKEIDDEFWSIANDLKSAYVGGDPERFGFGDTVISAMEDAINRPIGKAFAEYGFEDMSPEIIDEIGEFLAKLRNFPTEYFEAKILRAVAPSEFKAAVIPSDASAEVHKVLKDAGVVIHTYKRNDEADRRRVTEEAASGTEGVMFHKKPGRQGDLFAGSDADAHLTAVRNQLESLKAARDKKRNSGQESIETGRPDDLFSQARRQTDLTDEVPSTKEALTKEFIGRDDDFWGIEYNKRSGASNFKGTDYSGVTCTGYACAIMKKLGTRRVSVYGFGDEDNPSSMIAKGYGGHDFAVVDNRFIVDPWLLEFFAAPKEDIDLSVLGDQVVFDLKDPADAKMIDDLYGDKSKWKKARPSGNEITFADATAGFGAVREEVTIRVPRSQMALPFTRRAAESVKRDAAEKKNRVYLHPVQELSTSVEKITGPADVADIAGDIATEAQEMVIFVVADKKGAPLGVIQHSIGTVTSASVERFSGLGAALSIPGAKTIHMAHNHPSGNTELSLEDTTTTLQIRDLLEGSGVDFGHSVVVGHSVMYGDEQTRQGAMLTVPRNKKVKMFRRRLHDMPFGQPIESPGDLRSFVRSINEKGVQSGIVLIGSRGTADRVIDMTPSEMKNLKAGDSSKGLVRLLKNIHEENAVSSAIFMTDDSDLRAAANARTALMHSNVSVADILAGDRSMAESGRLDEMMVGIVLRMREGKYRTGVPAAHAQRIVDKFMDRLSVRPAVKVVNNFEQLPEEFRSRAMSAGAGPSDFDAAYDQASQNIYMVTDGLDSETEVENILLRHEITHFGLSQALDPKTYATIMDGIARDMPMEVRRKGNDYGFANLVASGRWFENNVLRRKAAEEVIASAAEMDIKGQKLPAKLKRWLDRLIDAMREFLIARGLKRRKYDRRFIESLITQVYEHLRTGGPARVMSQVNNPAEVSFRDAIARYPQVADGGGTTAQQDQFLDAAMAHLPDDQRPRFHERNANFYSGLLRAAQEVKLQKGRSQQWMGTLKNAKGVKAEEIEWVGLEEWLSEQDGPVTREQVVDFIAANQVQVSEKILLRPGAETTLESEMEKIKTELRLMGWYAATIDMFDSVAGEDRISFRDLEHSDGTAFWRDTRGNWIDRSRGDEELNDEKVLELIDRLDDVIDRLNASIDEQRASYEQFTLPGGRNYRELLLTLPGKTMPDGYRVEERPDGFHVINQLGSDLGRWRTREAAEQSQFNHPDLQSFRSAHFRHPNIVAHVRFKERIDSDGKSVLFIEEIQSDWHQEGREHGYRGQTNTPEMAKDFFKIEDETWNSLTQEERQSYLDEMNSDEPHVRRVTAVPNAPFKSSWSELAIKRMLRWAADYGFDRIAWTAGRQQSARYRLSTVFERIDILPSLSTDDKYVTMYHAGGRRSNAITVDDKGFASTRNENISSVNGRHVNDIFGKTLGGRIMSAKESTVIEGIDLEVGGEGMKAFYDQILPNTIGKLTKKWGASVSKTSVLLTDNSELAKIKERDGRFHIIQGGVTVLVYPTREKAEEALSKNRAVVHAVDVTPAMREAALQGLPLFHRRAMLNVFRRRKSVAAGTFDMEEGSQTSRIWNALVFRFQDKLYDLLHLQDAAKLFRGVAQIPEGMDAYLQETLFHGRVEDRVKQYEKEFVEPLIEKIKSAGPYTWQDVEDYLYARHAPEANARYLKINAGNPKYNSGMTDQDAANIIMALSSKGDIGQLRDIGNHIDDMTKWYRSMLVADGLETQDVIDQWENTYQHYVPLKGWAHDPDLGEMPTRGRGFDTGGKMTQERIGRTSRAANILANIVAQAQLGIIKSEKAKVGRAVLEFAKANPAPRLYEVNTVEYRRYIDKSTGLVRSGRNPGFKLADNVLVVRESGADHHISFNPTDPQMVRLARALKNLSASEMNGVMQFLHGINRFLSAINTSLNPEFVISNAFRDLQTAMVNIEATDAAKLRGKVLKNWKNAWNGIRRGELDKTGEWEDWWKRFRAAGAKVGWVDHYKNPADLEKKLTKALNRHGVVSDIAKGIEVAGQWIERQNIAVENSIRLSTFRAAIEAGVSEKRAAQIAKNLTVNFNKRGDWGVVMNSLYLFYNAAIQGTSIIVRTAKNKKARRIMYGIVALGIAQDILGRIFGGEDDDGENRYDKIPEWEKERNLILMLPPGARVKLWSGDEVSYLKVPMPYGYNWMYYLGTKVGGAIDYVAIGNKKRLNVAEDAARVGSSFMGAFNPLGWEASWKQMVMPTLGDPFLQVSDNQNWDGRPIMPPEPQYSIAPPDSQRYYRSASHSSRQVTSWLNSMTGGTEITPGHIDISPETIDHMTNFALGGVGRFFSNALNAAHDVTVDRDDLELYEVPMLRRLVGQVGDRQRSELFYSRMDQVEYARKEYDAALELRKAGDHAGYQEKMEYIDRKHGIAYKMLGDAKRSERMLRKLRDDRRLFESREGKMLERRRKENLERIRSRIEEEMDRFNRSWGTEEDARRSMKDTKDLIGKVGPIIEGKRRSEAVRAVRQSGMPALADLMSSLPVKPNPSLAKVLQKEV